MFANRFTAFVDACSLAGALKRNLILTLAEAEFFRLRWSAEVLEETERAIAEILEGKGAPDAAERATRARLSMEAAFEEAMVTDYKTFLPACKGLPDPEDAHVLAAALKTQAAVIVTDNLKDFPSDILAPLNIEARSTDEFLANTVALHTGRSVAAVRLMRERLMNPAKTPDMLLIEMEAQGLVETVDLLRPHVLNL
ncbi:MULTISPECIES: PIN domain-containing protein [Devosia]|uniref:PIN domain-containing protein n=1 Tax=Devosia TaxID=46913 RepID=UPI000CE94283|nr:MULTISPECIES: PIN domain-containing protein [Devosia]AVF02910.1 PIN domain-containing protein [Devosia sp. I507]